MSRDIKRPMQDYVTTIVRRCPVTNLRLPLGTPYMLVSVYVVSWNILACLSLHINLNLHMLTFF